MAHPYTPQKIDSIRPSHTLTSCDTAAKTVSLPPNSLLLSLILPHHPVPLQPLLRESWNVTHRLHPSTSRTLSLAKGAAISPFALASQEGSRIQRGIG
jgi:hypothetical protein